MAKATAGNGTTDQLAGVSNDGLPTIRLEQPYTVSVTLQGTCPMLFHRWSSDSIEAKASAAKNSKAKKTDDVDSYVYRNDDGEICIPGTYLYGAIAGPNGAAKYRQDPRSSRKSARDLYAAAIVVLTELASLGTANWDYLDRKRVMVQRAGVTRVRPAFHAGWSAEFDLMVQLPEYIAPADLLDVITQAGRLVGQVSLACRSER